jgi:hypothetical protein
MDVLPALRASCGPWPEAEGKAFGERTTGTGAVIAKEMEKEKREDDEFALAHRSPPRSLVMSKATLPTCRAIAWDFSPELWDGADEHG